MEAAANKIRALEAEIRTLKAELRLSKLQNDDLRQHILQQANASLDFAKDAGQTKWMDKKDAYIN